jgi:hypothetical protein
MKKPKVPGAVVRAAGKGTKAVQPTSALGENPHFCFEFADRATQNVWKFKPANQDATKLVEFLCDTAKMTWRDIDALKFKGRPKHHYQALSKVTRKARQDAQSRKLEKTFGDEMFRFRLGSTRRLWGFRAGRIFHVVWWDPGHKVYPTETSS